MNNIFNKHGFIILILCFAKIMTLQSLLAQMPENNDDDFLVFVTSHPTRQEIANRITNILVQNFEKAEKINERQEMIHGFSGGSQLSGYMLRCTNFYLFQKQLELLQWQHRTAGDGSIYKEVAQIFIIYTYPKHIKSAKEMASFAADKKFVSLTADDYIDAEIMLDRTVREWLDFLATNKTEEDRSDQILQLLEGNVEKADRIFKGFSHRLTFVPRPLGQITQPLEPQPVSLAESFARLYAEFYLQQKQIELLRWQYESAREEGERDTMAENLVATYEKQLVTAQKLVEMSKKVFQQLEMTVTTCLHCEILLDNTALELLSLTSKAANHGHDPIFSHLEKNVEKTGKMLKEFEELQEPANWTFSNWESWKSSYLLHVEFYLHQKQIELLRWQYEKTEGDEARNLAANELVAVYAKQVVTAKKIAQTNAELLEYARCTMKDYLDSEINLDQTTLDMLNFMLLIQVE